MVQVDVFTDAPSPATRWQFFWTAVDSARNLQALAREMNLSETTFILPGDAAAEKSRGVRVPHLHCPGRIGLSPDIRRLALLLFCVARRVRPKSGSI